MGSRLESIRDKVEQAKEGHFEAKELGERNVEDITNVKGILDGLPRDVDEDLVSAISDIHDSAINEATSDMEDEVRSALDFAGDIASDADEEAQDQKEKSEEARGAFDEIFTGSEFGSSAREGIDTAGDLIEGFEESSEEARESIEDAEEEFRKQLAEIQS